MKALILAAGLGTRLRPYTDHTPKPLFTIAGRPLLDIIIANLERAGCESIIINTHHLHREIERFVASRSYSVPVTTRHEPQILGTGGAIKNVADFWDERPFMVINADIVADVDLAEVYRTHCRQHHPATLVLCNNSDFNSVAVEEEKWISGFRDQNSGQTDERLLTFTGIQVLEPLILDYIPENQAYSSIDAFKKILAEDKKLQAWIIADGKWQDIGTPERYRRTTEESAVPLAFRAAFGDCADLRVKQKKLKGDGSERQWSRLKSGRQSLIMADHGIRKTLSVTEVDAFVHIGQHLYRRGVPVPEIHFYDAFCGLVFLEDLGDVNLQQVARETTSTEALVGIYKSVIDQLVNLSLRGARNFDTGWTYQSTSYDQELIIEKECRYFHEQFLTGYLGLDIAFEDLIDEFSDLARKALRYASTGFMHRDMQSRNIMVKDDRIYFIDFQAGRLGPIQYDLASLLIDPYVELPEAIRIILRDYCLQEISKKIVVDPVKFLRCFEYCRLTRNLQILGAFAFLSRVKGKRYFEDYIPAAVQTLKTGLLDSARHEFPALGSAVATAGQKLKNRTD
jgi:aminoglycoside/choline kinase family phosphotransferase/GTP:adenosylcobinamide-phosphate guanylyltransferase